MTPPPAAIQKPEPLRARLSHSPQIVAFLYIYVYKLLCIQASGVKLTKASHSVARVEYETPPINVANIQIHERHDRLRYHWELHRTTTTKICYDQIEAGYRQEPTIPLDARRPHKITRRVYSLKTADRIRRRLFDRLQPR